MRARIMSAQRMKDARGIATVGKATRQPIGDAKPTLGHRKQHHPAIRGEPSAIESGCDFLAPDGWKRERQQTIVGHGGRGVGEVAKRIGVSNQILRYINAFRHARQPKITARHE